MRRKLPMKKLITLAISTLIVLGVLIWVALLLIQNARQSVSTLAMHQSPSATAATHNGAPIIEACNVVSLNELKGKGIKLSGDPYPNTFVRTYIEGAKGATPLPDGLTIEDKTNSCHYRLQDRKDLFDAIVYHSSYSDMKALEAKIASEYNSQPNIGDMKVYKAETYHNKDEDFFNAVSTNEGNEDFILQKGDSALWFRLRDFKPSIREEVLHMVAANFSKLLQEPEARVTIDYRDSPIQGKLHKACELFTAENAALLLGQNTSPVVKEGYGGAPGTRNYETSHGRPDGYVYVAQNCERSTILPYNRLTMELRQYATEEGAKHFIQAAVSGDNGTRNKWQSIWPDLGDEAYADAENNENVPLGGVVHVRKDALVLTFSYHLSDDGPSSYRTTEQLRSVVTSVLERVK
jgi:hypothetical protein